MATLKSSTKKKDIISQPKDDWKGHSKFLMNALQVAIAIDLLND